MRSEFESKVTLFLCVSVENLMVVDGRTESPS